MERFGGHEFVSFFVGDIFVGFLVSFRRLLTTFWMGGSGVNDCIWEVSLWSCWSPLGIILRALAKICGPLPSEMTPKLDDFETQK